MIMKLKEYLHAINNQTSSGLKKDFLTTLIHNPLSSNIWIQKMTIIKNSKGVK